MSSSTKNRAPDVLKHEPEALTWVRRVAGLTQVEVARQLGISPSHMSELEGGTRSATNDMLDNLAGILGCPRVVLERKRVVVEAKRAVA